MVEKKQTADMVKSPSEESVKKEETKKEAETVKKHLAELRRRRGMTPWGPLLNHWKVVALVFALVGVVALMTRAKVDLSAPMVALIALIVAALAHFRQLRQSDIAAWDACHKRVGDLYDEAMKNHDVYVVLGDGADGTGKDRRFEPTWSVRQWVVNYLLALEQSTLASEFMRPRTRRAWEKHVRAQLQKPTIRAEFFEDCGAYDANWSDEFVRLALEALPEAELEACIRASTPQDSLWSVLRKRFGYLKSATTNIQSANRSVLPMAEEWKAAVDGLYSDESVKQFMLPLREDDAMTSAGTSRFVVVEDQEAIFVGTFTVTKMPDGTVEIGFAVAPDHRKRGVGRYLVDRALEKARELHRAQTVRATVFDDNYGALTLLAQSGFRKFSWLERNFPEGS